MAHNKTVACGAGVDITISALEFAGVGAGVRLGGGLSTAVRTAVGSAVGAAGGIVVVVVVVEYTGADTDNDDIVTDIPESASEVVNLPTNEVVLPVLNFSIAAKAVTSVV